jgi:tripartite-type tricarboxylate transporter receptor subunit TctC
MGKRVLASLASLAIAALLPTTSHADPVADFFTGRPMTMVIGYTSGGGYDLYARVLSKHMGKHLPGNPTITPQNMPGAGSLKAANFLYSVAPKDGSVIGIFGRGMAMEPLLGNTAAKYDARKFSWLGSGSDQISVCATWHTSRIKTWDDAMKYPGTFAGEGPGSDPDLFATILRNVLGSPMKLISGYPGGAEMNLAMERGEVDGRCGWSWSSVKLSKSDWIKEKKLNFILQMALEKSPELPNVPFVMDYAKTDSQRDIFKVILGRQTMGWPFTAPPGVPSDRVAALRKAFDDTMRDPEFLAEAKARKLDVNPMNGEAVSKLVDAIYQTPKASLDAARAAIVAKDVVTRKK